MSFWKRCWEFTKNHRRWILSFIASGTLLTVVSIYVNVLTLRATQEGNTINQRTYNRAAGKIGAKFIITGIHPPLQASIDKELARHQKPIKVLPSIDSPNLIRLLDPRIYVKNIGDEPIDGFLLQTRTGEIGVHVKGFGNDALWNLADSWRLPKSDQEEFNLKPKLQPGKEVSIPIGRGIVSQLSKAPVQKLDKEIKKHFAKIEFTTTGRLYGTNNFDEVSQNAESQVAACRITIIWSPRHFTKEACDEFMEKYNSEINFLK